MANGMSFGEAGDRGRWKDPPGPMKRYKKIGLLQPAWNELPKGTVNVLKPCTSNVEHYIMTQTMPRTTGF